MNAYKLTDKQKQALEVYNELFQALGYPPSIAEFKKAYGVSSNSTAFSMLYALRKRGFNCYTRGQAKDPGNRSAVFSMGDADKTVELNRLRKLCAELVDENEGLKVELHQARLKARELTAMLKEQEQPTGMESWLDQNPKPSEGSKLYEGWKSRRDFFAASIGLEVSNNG